MSKGPPPVDATHWQKLPHQPMEESALVPASVLAGESVWPWLLVLL